MMNLNCGKKDRVTYYLDVNGYEVKAQYHQEDIDTVFREAYKMGIKGTTIYRDRCRDSQVLKSVSSEDVHCKTGACGL